MQGDFTTWQLQKASKQVRKAAEELNTILQMINNGFQQMEKSCSGCQEEDTFCDCTLEVRRENEFEILLLLETPNGLQWCPTSTVDSMYFNCQHGNFMKIRASQVCDGFPDCPRAGDESTILCRSFFLKMMIYTVVLFVYSIATAMEFIVGKSGYPVLFRPKLGKLLKLGNLTKNLGR